MISSTNHMAFEASSSDTSWRISPAPAVLMASGSQSLSRSPRGWCLWARARGIGWCKRRGPTSPLEACWCPGWVDASHRTTWAPSPPLRPSRNDSLWDRGPAEACWMSWRPFWFWWKTGEEMERENVQRWSIQTHKVMRQHIRGLGKAGKPTSHYMTSSTCPSKHSIHHIQFQLCPLGVSTHLLLLFFLLGAFLTGTTGLGVPLLLLGFEVFVILGVLGGLIGVTSSSIFRCFSFSTFFFFFLSFFSFFFLGLTMGPCESAVSCSCTALSWGEKKRQMCQWNTEETI